MKTRAPFRLPADKEAELGYLVRLERWNLGFRFSIAVVLFFVIGGSQAMKAAWLEAVLSLLPPIAFLIAIHFRRRPPNQTFPYGYDRAAIVAFLCSAVALTLVGSYLVVDSGRRLVEAEHPSIGSIQLFGETFWMGWLMIPALIYSVIPPVIVGHLQEPAAAKVHEKTVFVDAKMSKADWMTGLAAIVGVAGVGWGYWWADAAAGALIGLDVTKDGVRSVKEAVGDLVDRRPRFTSGGKSEGMAERLEETLRATDWIQDAAVRLREEGHAFTGEAFIVPTSNHNLTERIDKITDFLSNYDWRVHEVIVTPVTSLKHPFETE